MLEAETVTGDDGEFDALISLFRSEDGEDLILDSVLLDGRVSVAGEEVDAGDVSGFHLGADVLEMLFHVSGFQIRVP